MANLDCRQSKIILQQIFKFSDNFECFVTFRSVCKSWKLAIESQRFNTFPSESACTYVTLNLLMGRGIPLSFTKYFQSCEKFSICTDGFWPTDHFFDETGTANLSLEIQAKINAICAYFLNNMTNLKELAIFNSYILHDWHLTTDSQEYRTFILTLLQNNSQTLRKIKIPAFLFPITFFPKLNFVQILSISPDSQEFECSLQNLLTNSTDSLKVIRIDLWNQDQEFTEFLSENYSKYLISCISYTYNNFGCKILSNLDVNQLLTSDFPYRSIPEYIHFKHVPWKNPNPEGWEFYRRKFDMYLNLKGISFGNITEKDELSNENHKQIWREGFEYFRSRNIQILNETEFFDENRLELQFAQREEISWRFRFNLDVEEYADDN